VNTAVTVDQSQLVDSLPINIEAIKKAFIQLNQLPAANEQLVRSAADNAHVMCVKDWLQDLERELGFKAKVVASPSECGLTVNAPAAIVGDEAVLFANYIDNQKMALDTFEYVTVGLLGIQRLLNGSTMYQRIFNQLDLDTKEYMAKVHHLDLDQADDCTLLVKLYLASLASLNVRLTWLERRDAWQRQLLRMVYPKFKMTSLDLHYLLLKARRLIKRSK
jgi:hypothetical protein